MTTDCRPGIVDTNNLLQKTYEEQRKCRMQDAIDDYLQDDKVSSRQVYEEILSCVQDVIDYHKKSLDRAVDLKSFMMGNSDINNVELLTEKWQYDKLPERF